MHDPFAMRPFFGYNFGDYLAHWLSIGQGPDVRLPKIFHVNWFRKSPSGGFLWPGFGENIRVLEWMFRRLSGESGGIPSAVGYLPAPGSLNLSGLNEQLDLDELFHLSREFWEKEVQDIRSYFDKEVNDDVPNEVRIELEQLARRVQRL